MLVKELIHCPHFSQKELTQDGTALKLIPLQLMQKFEDFRIKLNKRIKILCIGGGKHLPNSMHNTCEAIDFYIFPQDGNVSNQNIIELAIDSKFKGVGVYWNGTINSYHLDTRDECQLWSGVKSSGNSWKYGSIIKELL